MKIGSEAHKDLFCHSFMESYRAYEPENLPWPDLDRETLARLQGIPFWEEALNTECRAGAMVSAFAATISDPILQEAIALQAIEESRHARLIQFLLDRYDIKTRVQNMPELTENVEQAFIRFGFGECFDSFFAFGLFGIARQSGFFPESLLAIFDPIIAEEARHILFFVNWIAYRQVNCGREFNLLRGIHSLWHYGRALRHRSSTFQGGSNGNGAGFTATGARAVSVDLTLEKFLATCLEENAKRMSLYDDRLLRPEFMPAIAAFALRTVKLLPGSQASK